jgi:N-acetylglutamate synthase-like GNAT family acetyltransferase
MKKTKENVHVRVAGPEDFKGIMHLAMLLNKENSVFPMNEEKVANMVIPSLFRDGGIMGVIGKPDMIEGLVLLRVATHWYSDGEFLEEMCVFVHPDYRSAKGGRARKLVEFAKKVSEELQKPLIIGVLSSSRADAKVKLYERQFGEPSGAFFLYGMKTGELANASEIIS